MRPRALEFAFTAIVLAFVLLRAVGALPVAQQEPPLRPRSIKNRVLSHALDVERGLVPRSRRQQLPSSGIMYAVQAAAGHVPEYAVERNVAALAESQSLSGTHTRGCQNVFAAGGRRNVRVNQDCSLRKQSEEVIAINPTNPRNLIVGMNDARIGFNHCGFSWSLDGGRTWGDQTPPFFDFVMTDEHTADVCSDPTVAFDLNGNAYIGGVLFDVFAAPTALVVAKSNAGIGGTFFHTPVNGPTQTLLADPLGIVANDGDPAVLNDKPFLTVDVTPGSPKVGRLYMTWTRLNSDAGAGSNSPIYFSQSSDGGATWSDGIEISGANSAVCSVDSAEPDPNACDQDHASHPAVGPDGTVYVAFNNFNASVVQLSTEQQLLVSCPAAADCSNPASWTPPVRVSRSFGSQPFGPDAATGCRPGRQCLPPNGYQVNDFGSLSVDVQGRLYFVWADFRNGAANCGPFLPANGAVPPCDNDVFYAASTDGGAAWSAPVDLTPAAVLGPSAQWQPWSTVVPNGTTLWVAYYDRSYGNCEFEGCNDITLAKIDGPETNTPTVTYKRLTTSSMPNLVPANNPVQKGFLGDYMWVAADPKGRPYVVWGDTRGRAGIVETDVYFAKGPKP